MKCRVKYKTVNKLKPIAEVILYNARWDIKNEYIKLLKGQEKIRGRLVNRTIAATEILSWSEMCSKKS